MYAAAPALTQTPLLGDCTMTGTNAQLACKGAPAFNNNKFLTALVGQHLLRTQALAETGFTDGALAFAYLDTAPELDFMLERPNPTLLPANLWEIGDQARIMLENSATTGSFRQNLAQLGYPSFVQDSVDPARSAKLEQHQLRLAWFWLGFTFDPSFARIHQSNATKVGEYMVASLNDENMFVHNTFQANMRLLVKGYLPEANVRKVGRQRQLETVPPQFQMNYSYFVAYNRAVLRWNENRKAGVTVPQPLKDEQAELWHRFTANGFRMSLYLYSEALDDGAAPTGAPLEPIGLHFDTYESQYADLDHALLDEVAAKLEAATP